MTSPPTVWYRKDVEWLVFPILRRSRSRRCSVRREPARHAAARGFNNNGNFVDRGRARRARAAVSDRSGKRQGRFFSGGRIQQNKNFVESSGREFYFSEIVRYMHRHVRDLHSELRCVLLEELKIQPDVFQRCPRFCLYGVGVQVIDPRTLHGQQKR